MSDEKIIRVTCQGADTMPLSEIKELQGQLKSLSKTDYEKLKKSILDLGFSFPLEIAKVNDIPVGIVDGHQRLRTVRNMIQHEDYALADNRLPVCWKFCANEQEAGNAILAAVSQYGQVEEEGLNELMARYGMPYQKLRSHFKIPDFDTSRYIAGYHEDKVSADADESLPEPPKVARTERGDLFELGGHRLLCGDSIRGEDITRLMAGLRAQCMFTDPPYAIYGSSTGVSASVADDKMVRSFFRDILSLATKSVVPFGHIYICCDYRSWTAWWDMARESGVEIKNCIVWDKQSPGMGSMFQNQHEFILFASNHCQQTTLMSKHSAGQRLISGIGNVWSVPRVPTGDKEHNAQKPIELIRRGLAASTDKDDIIFDPFLGSGSTMIAAQHLTRRCFGLEISPVYCDVIIQRWCNLTKTDPETIYAQVKS